MAIAVIKAAIISAKKNNDFGFFSSPLFHFYAGLAYGGKTDYRSDDDIINDIISGELEKDLRKDNGGQKSKYNRF